MILAEQPSIENLKHERELIAHIQPADDELLAQEGQVEVVPEGPADEDDREDEDDA